MKAHDLPRPYRMAVPEDVVPTIDALKAQGHKQRAIAKALGIHWQTVYNVLRRNGAYSRIPRTTE
jgi:DNA invertase Pin-like site-specific DNA recombinase